VNAELGVGLEPGGQCWERLDETAREDAVAGQYVSDALSEDALDDTSEEGVAGAISPIGFADA